MSKMEADVTAEADDFAYGTEGVHLLRFRRANSCQASIVLFLHGGSWRAGTYLEFTSSTKVSHLVEHGYAFATVNYALVPAVTVKE